MRLEVVIENDTPYQGYVNMRIQIDSHDAPEGRVASSIYLRQEEFQSMFDIQFDLAKKSILKCIADEKNKLKG